MGGIALLHGIEHLIPGGAAHSLGMGKEGPERDVGKGTLHALIGSAVAAQHLGLVLLGHVHHVLHMIPVIGAQGRVPDPRFGLVQHHLFAGGIKDGQAVGLLYSATLSTAFIRRSNRAASWASTVSISRRACSSASIIPHPLHFVILD